MVKNLGAIDPLVSLNFSMDRRQGEVLAYIAACYLKLNGIKTAHQSSQTSFRRKVTNRSNGDGQIRPCYLNRLSLGKQR